MSSSPQELLQRGIAAAKAGQNDVARQLLARALQMDPRNEQAWLWLSGVAQSDEERVRILQQILRINPENQYAIKGLRVLGALPQEEAQPSEPPPEETEHVEAAEEVVAPPPEEEVEEVEIEETVEPERPPAHDPSQPFASPVTSSPPPPAPEGIPLIEPNVLAYVQSAADQFIRAAMETREEVTFDVTWVPTRKRFRRRIALNPVMIGGIVVGIIVLAGIIFGVYSLITRPRAQRAVGEGIPTPTPTITLTPTGTATQTPQPSPTATLAPGQPTFTPEATIALDAPRGDLDFGLTATPIYFSTVHPDNPRLDDAIAKYWAGDYQAVIDEIPTARETGPDQPDSYFFEGMAYAEMGQYERAAAVINDGLDQDSNNAALHAALGYIFYRQGALEESRRENELAKQLDPALIMPYLTLAQDYRDAGLYEEALFEVESALRLDAHNVEVLVEQGKIYMAQASPGSAAAIGNLAVYIDPTAEDAVLLLGEARIRLGQYGQAVNTLESYVGRVNPASEQAWTLLGEARLLEGSQAKALDAFSKASLLAEDSSQVLVFRGTLLLEQGAYEDAFADFDDAIEQNDTSEARFGRAQAAVQTERYEVALEDIEIVLEEDPFNTLARLIRGQALTELGRHDEALDELNSVLAAGLESESDRATAFEYRGRAEYFLMLYGDSILDLEEALEFEETGTRHFYRGLALEASLQVTDAIREYEWVLFWDRIYGYPFADVAAEHLENLNEGGNVQGSDAFVQPSTLNGEDE